MHRVGKLYKLQLFFFTFKRGIMLKFCTVIETNTSDHFNKIHCKFNKI